MCGECPKRGECTKICDKVEKLLNNGQHSIKSNYLVKFINPSLIECMRVDVVRMSEGRFSSLDLYNIVLQSMKCITKSEKFCLTRYYGLDGNGCCTQCAIAKEKHVSQHTVYHHIKKAKIKLRVELKRLLNI